MNHIAGLVLAGGQSARMGEDKAQLNRDGQSMLQFNQSLLIEASISNIFVSRNQGDGIRDVIEKRGPLAGIYSSLLHIRENSKHQAVLIVAVDMPLLTAQLLHQLCTHGQNTGRPACFADNYFPLYLPINQDVIDYLKAQLFSDDGNLKVKGLIKAFDGDFLDHQQQDKLINTNTPQQWQQSQIDLAKRG